MCRVYLRELAAWRVRGADDRSVSSSAPCGGDLAVAVLGAKAATAPWLPRARACAGRGDPVMARTCSRCGGPLRWLWSGTLCMNCRDEHDVDTGRQGFQPETESAFPRLPDGSVPVSGVVPPPTRAVSFESVMDADDRARERAAAERAETRRMRKSLERIREVATIQAQTGEPRFLLMEIAEIARTSIPVEGTPEWAGLSEELRAHAELEDKARRWDEIVLLVDDSRP